MCVVFNYTSCVYFFFQTECENLGLEKFYRTYVQRLQRSSLSVFFVMHTVMAMVHTIILVATQVWIYFTIFFLEVRESGFLSERKKEYNYGSFVLVFEV